MPLSPASIVTPSSARRIRDLSVLDRLVVGALVLAIAVIGGWGYSIIVEQHRTPLGDTAVITQAARTAEVDRPLLGQGNTASMYGNPFSRHPGPALFYAAFAATKLLGVQYGGCAFAIGAAAIALLVAGWAGLRNGGPRVGLAFVVAGAAVAATAIPGFLFSMNITYVGVLPFFACLCLAWALSVGDWAVLPLLVIGASFVLQVETVYIAPLVPVLLCALVLALTGRRSANGAAPMRGKSIALATIVGLVAWAPPIYDELFRTHNLSKLASVSVPVHGWRGVSQALGTLLSFPPKLTLGSVLLTNELVSLSIGSVLLAVAIAFALLWVWRKRRASKVPLLISLAVLLGAALAGYLLPATDDTAWHLLWIRTDLLFLVAVIASAIPARRRPRAKTSRWPVVLRILAVLAACGLLLIGVQPGHLSSLDQRASDSINTLTPVLNRALPEGSGADVTYRGIWTDSIAPGLALRLTGLGQTAVSSRAPLGNTTPLFLVTRGGPVRRPHAHLLGSVPAAEYLSRHPAVAHRVAWWVGQHGPLELSPGSSSSLASLVDGFTPSVCISKLIEHPKDILGLPDRLLVEIYADGLASQPILPPDLNEAVQEWTAALPVQLWQLPPRQRVDPNGQIYLSKSSC